MANNIGFICIDWHR